MIHRCSLISHLNILFLPIPTVTLSSAIPLKLQHQIENFNQNYHENGYKPLKNMTKKNSLMIQRRVDAPIVGTLLVHPVLPHNLLLTFATHNKEGGFPSLRNPMRGRGPGSSCHMLFVLIFINYYKFLIL